MKYIEDGVYRAESWIDLHKELFDFPPHPQHGRFHSPYAYRGMDSAAFDLSTSLMRIGNTGMESHLLRNFKKFARASLRDERNDWELLAVAQHHGLPTRMLDWSFSPYVALHFATSDLTRYSEDGAVWCLDVGKVHDYLPQRMKDKLAEDDLLVFTVELLDELFGGIQDLDQAKEGDDFVICLDPPSIDERIVNQYAMFTIMTNPNRGLGDWLRDNPSLYRKVIIPAELKLEVRDKLDQANINERIIYPGLQGISAWLKRHCTNIDLFK